MSRVRIGLRSRADGEALTNYGDVAFGCDQVGVGPGWIRGREETVEAAKILVEAGNHKLLPECGGLLGEVTWRTISSLRLGHPGERVGLGKFGKKDIKFFRVIRGGELAEVIGGGQRAAQHALNGFAKLEPTDFMAGTGAIDGTDHAFDFPSAGAERWQIGGRKRAAAQHMAESVFRPGPGGIAAQLEVAGVMQQNRDDREFELPGVGLGNDSGMVTTGEQLYETDGRLQRVLEIMIAQVDRRIVGVPTFKQLLDVDKNPVDPSGGLAGIQLAKRPAHKSGHGRPGPGVDVVGHRWEESKIALLRSVLGEDFVK